MGELIFGGNNMEKPKNVKDTRILSVGTLDVIFIVLFILKLFGLINVSWWIVFIPIVLPFGLAVIILLVAKYLL